MSEDSSCIATPSQRNQTTPCPLIDLPNAAIKLRHQHRARDHDKSEAWHDSGLLFTTKHGTPIEPRNFLRAWDTRCGKAGVRKITVHDGRRSCGSLLADLDVHPRVAMRILRHAQFAQTMEIYTEVSSEQTRAAVKKPEDATTCCCTLLLYGVFRTPFRPSDDGPDLGGPTVSA